MSLIFEEPRAFSAVNRLVMEGFFLNIPTSHSTKFCYNHCIFGVVGSIIQCTLLEEQSKFSAVSRLPLEGYS